MMVRKRVRWLDNSKIRNGCFENVLSWRKFASIMKSIMMKSIITGVDTRRVLSLPVFPLTLRMGSSWYGNVENSNVRTAF